MHRQIQTNTLLSSSFSPPHPHLFYIIWFYEDWSTSIFAFRWQRSKIDQMEFNMESVCSKFIRLLHWCFPLHMRAVFYFITFCRYCFCIYLAFFGILSSVYRSKNMQNGICMFFLPFLPLRSLCCTSSDFEWTFCRVKCATGWYL